MAGVRFEMYQEGNLVWSIEVPEAEMSMIAGLADACSYVFDMFNINGTFHVYHEGHQYRLSLYEIYRLGGATVIDTMDKDTMTFSENQLELIGTKFVWLSNMDEQAGAYMATAFESPKFIQGYIMGCNACGFDFREATHGKPFKINADGSTVYYDIAGYNIENPDDMPTQIN